MLLVIVKIKELLEVEIKVRNYLPDFFRKMFIWDNSKERSDTKISQKEYGEMKLRIIGTGGFKHDLQTINVIKRAKFVEEVLQIWT